MTIIRIYDEDARLLGYLHPGQARMVEPCGESGSIVQCMDSRPCDSPVVQDGDMYARMAEFVVHRATFEAVNVGGTVLTSLVMPAPFDELWDWPGFVRFEGWDT